ncbi:hypothetical protein [Paenibacillus sedimenti]|uniref:PepSY domain-containing protein n=1 Tax=Paenibacillus sedimenti TaxID=2770274 RepID=A0A926QNT7_9BACL|nr:hypothetical protein [Paenibacillus sedimenti]MBD0384699.1 hypothetical protein [Paenibacillus sedimenti]
MFTSKMLLIIFLSFSSLIPISQKAEISTRSQKVLQNIDTESENTLQVKWNTVTQTPELLSGKLTKPSAHSPQWITYNYLEKIKTLYGLKHVNKDLKIMTIDKNATSIKVVLQRQLFKNSVCGNQLLVELDYSGVVQRIYGTLHTDLEEKRLGRPMYPAVSAQKAKRIALNYDKLLEESNSITIESCYMPNREGVPLIHVLTYEREGRPVSIKIHSLTGRIIE